MALLFIVTHAGRAALVNAANTGTAPVTIAQVGLTATAVTPTPTATALPGEFKRLATLSGDVVADDTIHLIVRDEGGDVFTVRSLAMYLADGTLFGIYGQAGVLIEKSAQAMMLLGIDVKFEDIAATGISFGDANFLNPPATTETMGVVELSTLAETIAGLDTTRVPAARMVRDAVTAWLDARFGAGNAGIWHPANDGAGSGLDADLLDGQQGSYYSNITARLGYTPVQQGTGNGQLGNIVKLGWSGSRLKASVDVTDLGNVVFDGQIGDVWRASNDGAGSGLDADLLDGQEGSYYANITARLGYTPLNRAGDTVTGTLTFGPGSSADFATNDIWPSMRVFRNNRAGSDGLFVGYGNANGGRTRIYGDGSTGGHVFPDGGGNLYRSDMALYWHSANDGSGSGMDADMVDGWHRDSIRDWNNLLNKPFNWSGQAGQPQWLWGSNDGGQYYVWNPANFSVAYASGAGNADTVDGLHASAFVRLGADNIAGPATSFATSGPSDDVFGGLQLREVGWTSNADLSWSRAPGISFHWSSVAAAALRMTSDGHFRFRAQGTDWNSYRHVFAGNFYSWGHIVWSAGNDGAGSGLDADMVDGWHCDSIRDWNNLLNKPFDFGSNGNGYWERRPNGVIEQWGKVTEVRGEGASYHDFPIPFTDLASVNVQVTIIGQGSTANDMWVQLHPSATSLTQFAAFYQSASSGNNGHGYTWRAVGR